MTRTDVRHEQTQRENDQREQDLLRTVLAQPLEELRTDAVADCEQEQQEEGRLDRSRHLDAELTDRDGREQRRGDVAETEAGELLRSDPEADGEREEQRELRVRAQRLNDPLPDIHVVRRRFATRLTRASRR